MVYYDLLSSCVVLFDVVWFSMVLNGLLGLLLSCLVLESYVCLNAGGQERNKLFKQLTHVFDCDVKKLQGVPQYCIYICVCVGTGCPAILFTLLFFEFLSFLGV